MNKFLKQYFLFLFLFIAIGQLPILYLYRTGEYDHIKEIIKKQSQSSKKIIYGTALTNNMYFYKKSLLKSSKPKVIALGSSRVMQLRQSMFLEGFLNLGGAMGWIKEGLSLAPDILKVQPDIVLLGIDIWWFNDRYINPDAEYTADIYKKTKPSINHSLTVSKWLYDDKISLQDVANSILFGINDVGVSGNRKDGFALDGSYYYTRTVTGEKESDDKLFLDTLSRIDNGNLRFEYNSLVNSDLLDDFFSFIEILESNNIEVIVFFPPFGKIINERMYELNEKYGYIDVLKSKLKLNKIIFYDYSDASLIGSNDCEFIDGFHGGEITYLRILNDLVKNKSSLSNYVNQSALRENIEKNKGKSFVFDNEITSKVEVDFLGFGCNKEYSHI